MTDRDGIPGFLHELAQAQVDVSLVNALERHRLLHRSGATIDRLRGKSSALARSSAWNADDIVSRLRAAVRDSSRLDDTELAELLRQSEAEIDALNTAWNERVVRATEGGAGSDPSPEGGV